MKIEHHRFHSRALGQDFELKSYGSAGKPVMAFPTSCGRFFDYEERGMISAAAGHIENGDIMVFAVDGRDRESWYKPVRDEWIGLRQAQYESCITEEAVAFIAEKYGVSEKFMATGASFGAFHSANFFLKFPGVFDSALCLSGVYHMQAELGGYTDAGLRRSEPLSYLPELADAGTLSELRNGYLVIAHGRGAWETFNDQARSLAAAALDKGITCWYDVWDENWPHDWHTWHAQMRKFLPCFRDGVLFRDGTLRLIGKGRRIARLRPA